MIETRKWGTTTSFGPRQWLRHRLLVKELSKRLEQGLVLDAGCGEGRLASLIFKKGYQVFAFDESKESLRRATMADKSVRPPLGQDRTVRPVCSPAYWQGQMDQIPFPENSFDAIISGDVLEHLPDDQAAVKELFRILKPGGIAMVSVPADPKKWSIDDDWSGHQRRYAKEELYKLFQQAGFERPVVFHWGWPIIWIYYRLYYIPMLRWRLNQSRAGAAPAGVKESPLLDALFSLCLLPDRLFPGAPWGIGLIGVFRKPKP